MQQFTSAATSINSKKVPALFTKLDKKKAWKEGGINLDLGGGKYDTATEFLASRGVQSFIYDPYNRSQVHNHWALENAGFWQSDTVTISNVLNVIKEREQRLLLLMIAKGALKDGGKVYITVYEGDNSHVGRESKAGCYQMNCCVKFYANEIMRSGLFTPEQIEVVNGVIVITN